MCTSKYQRLDILTNSSDTSWLKHSSGQICLADRAQKFAATWLIYRSIRFLMLPNTSVEILIWLRAISKLKYWWGVCSDDLRRHRCSAIIAPDYFIIKCGRSTIEIAQVNFQGDNFIGRRMKYWGACRRSINNWQVAFKTQKKMSRGYSIRTKRPRFTLIRDMKWFFSRGR